MKIGRRSFLSFLIGGAAGTTLSPLPWKLMDDSSIWTQMWPWTPVPEDGDISYINSTCSLCPGGCGITVRKINDRAVKIEGMKGHPVNDGGVCLLGLSGLQLLYGPVRIKTPLKRVGKRGKGKWKKISWDEAISAVVKNMTELRIKGLSHTTGCILGSDYGTVPMLFERLLTVYGSPNVMTASSIQDSYELIFYLMHGIQAVPGFDFNNSDYILSFGSGLIDGWGSPVHMFKANSNWKSRNVKIVQIEPRLSNTAAKADKWIPVNPGTEAALVLGIAHVIIKNEWYNRYFVENYTTGFKDLKEIVLKKYAPETVAGITGVDINTINKLAGEFSSALKPLALAGKGRGNTPGSLDEFAAVHVLNALSGNINKSGGIFTVSGPDYIRWPEVEMDGIASAGMQKDRLDGAGTGKYTFTRNRMHKLAGAINSKDKYPLNLLFVSGANPLYSLSDTMNVKKAFDRIPMIVSFSPYMDETTKNADLVLPGHIYLERYEDVPVTTAGLLQPVVGLTRPVVKPLYDTMHTGDAVIRIAKGLGKNVAAAFKWRNYYRCLRRTMDIKWTDMVKKGFYSGKDFCCNGGETSFDTPSGKFEFVNDKAKALFEHISVAVEGKKENYPLILVPYDSIRLSSNFVPAPPFAIKTLEDTVLKKKDVFIEINPETAEKNGIRDGQRVVLKTPKGKVIVRAHFFDGIMPGIIAMPKGLGHTAYDEYFAEKGINFNELIGPVDDPVSGLDAAWGIRAKISPV